MDYLTMLDVPDVIKDFYSEVEYQDLVSKATHDEEGVIVTPAVYALRVEVELKQRPEFKSDADVSRLLSLGKPLAVIEKFIALTTVSEQWLWFDRYNKYLVKLESVIEFNANLSVIGQDENGGDILEAIKDLPDEPIRPTLLTVDEYKNANKALFDSYNKRIGVEINGHTISLNKDNSDGLVSIKTGYDLIGDAIFPTNFIADTVNGIKSIAINDYAEFTNFAVLFIAARGGFFK